LICPNCRNEYFGEAVCPSCGMTEEHALRKAAEELLKQERYALAAEYLGRILHKNPHDVEAWKMQAGAFARMALSSGDPTELAHAEVVLHETVHLDWEWETGHQFRIQIAEKSERLDELVREYRAISLEEASDRSAMAVRMIQVIQLTLQFKSEMARTREGGVATTKMDVLLSFWPLTIGLPFIFVTAQNAIMAYSEKEPVIFHAVMVVLGIFGTAFLLFYNLRRVKGTMRNSGKKGRL